MNLEDVIFIDNLPSIDLHGFDECYARVKINEFINDNKIMKNSIVAVIHGLGSGIIKKVTHDTLKKNKDVIDYRLFYNNTGVTIAKIKIDKK